MSRNAPRNIDKDTYDKSMKAIKTAYTQFQNGYTITPKDYSDVVEALRELKRLPALILYYTGLEDEDI